MTASSFSIRSLERTLLCMRTLPAVYLVSLLTRSMPRATRTLSSAIPATPPAAKKAKIATPTKTPAGTPKKAPDTPKQVGDKTILFSLQDDDELVRGIIQARPSKRNRSPYVADVKLIDEDREAVVHVPNLDMGGKCVPGVIILLKPSRDNKGNRVSADAVSPKFGTPKCEFKAQLLYVDETHLSDTLYPPVWVGAHPSLGERIAECWLRNNLVEGIPKITHVQNQIRNPCGADMRSDFLLTHEDGSKRIVEVKTVVDTDYSGKAPPDPKLKCRFLTDADPYQRTGIFPWGNSNHKGPKGEKVVSARAIHHVQELTRIAQGKLTEDGEKYKATVLFVVIRGDAEAFRPNYDACPSFCKYLKEAEEGGVQILAKRVFWGTEKDEGVCYSDKMLPIDWPDMSEEDE